MVGYRNLSRVNPSIYEVYDDIYLWRTSAKNTTTTSPVNVNTPPISLFKCPYLNASSKRKWMMTNSIEYQFGISELSAPISMVRSRSKVSVDNTQTTLFFTVIVGFSAGSSVFLLNPKITRDSFTWRLQTKPSLCLRTIWYFTANWFSSSNSRCVKTDYENEPDDFHEIFCIYVECKISLWSLH